MRAPGTTLLLDCGGTSLPAIRRELGIGDLDAVAVTHLHGDHFGGLPYLIMAEHFLGRKRELVVAGPPSLEDRTSRSSRALYADFDWKDLAYPLRFETLGATETALAGARVTAHPVRHVPASEPHGLRVRVADRLIAYSGDATWSDALPALANGADLFICEATNYEREDPVHLSVRELRAHRAELRAKRVIVTHLSDDTQAHLTDLDRAGIEHARDGLALEI